VVAIGWHQLHTVRLEYLSGLLLSHAEGKLLPSFLRHDWQIDKAQRKEC
jgi:hypothetical protein